jgi:Spy/CpxP family protein refolding chaperone
MIVTSSTLAAAVAAEPHPRRIRTRHVERIRERVHGGWMAGMERLDLKDEQRDKLRQIRRAGLETMSQKRVAVAQARMDLHDLMREKDASAASLRQAHDKLARARMDLESATFDLRLQMRDVLTPAQREELRKSVRRVPRRVGLMELDDAPVPEDHDVPADDFGALDELEPVTED